MDKNKKKNINKYYLLFSILIFLMLTFPFFSIGNKIEPYILGVPFIIAWVVIIIIIQFIGLVFFYIFENFRREK